MEGIVFVSVDPDLTALAFKIQKELGIKFTLFEINMSTEDQTEQVILIDENVKVIVSRGGTLRYIRDRYTIPVIEVAVDFADIMNSIRDVIKKGGRKIAFISSSMMRIGDFSFTDVGGIDYTVKSYDSYATFEDRQKVEAELITLIESGQVDAVIRDALAIPSVDKSGIIVSVLKSGENAVRRSLREASRIRDSIMLEENRRKEFETIINQMDRCTIIVDCNKLINICNQAAQRLFSKSLDQMIGKSIESLIPLTILEKIENEGPSGKGEIFEYNGVKLVAQSSSLVMEEKVLSRIITVERLNYIFDKELLIRKNLYQKEGLVAHYTFDDIKGNSKELHDLKYRASRYAKTSETVLIIGETGTGKELFAQSIHNASNYCNGPFLSLNCASLSDNLLESELFGYEEGTFTGAIKGGKKGLFEIAHLGTIFLDEIAKTSLGFQATLLRVIQERQIRRIGGNSLIPIDVRIICSTNKLLKDEVQKGTFLEDLYYRISALELEIPPLRERKTDIIALALYLVTLQSNAQGITVWWQDDSIFEPMIDYDWPGNIRQLENFIKRVIISQGDGELNRDLIKESLRRERMQEVEKVVNIKVSSSMSDMEQQMYEKLFELYNEDKARFCRDYNISRTTLWRKLNLLNKKTK